MPRNTSVAAIVAGLLALGFAVDANAAVGYVALSAKGKPEKGYLNPKPGCHPALGAGTTVTNGTDRVLRLFPDGNCLTRIDNPLKPGQGRTGDFGSFQVL